MTRITLGLSDHLHLFGCGDVSSGGDVRANLLRVIAPKGSHGDVISENFVHVFYNDVRVKSFNTVEILLRGDTGRPIPFSGGVVEVTLHFKKK